MTNTASSAMPLPAKEILSQPVASTTDSKLPALTFSPSTKFTGLSVSRQRSHQSQHDSEGAESDSDDLPSGQLDSAMKRMYRDKARDAIKKEQVHMEGFLYKKSGGGASKTWNKRWCVLRSQALLIYKRFSEDKLKRIVRVEEIVDVRTIERRNHSFVFEIETPDRSFFFEASSEQEMLSWIGRIRSVVTAFNNKNSSASSSVRHSLESLESRRQSDEQQQQQFANTLRVSSSPPPPPKDCGEPYFMSLPSAGSRRSQISVRAANSLFVPAVEGSLCAPLGLRIDTPRTLSKSHGAFVQFASDTSEAAAVLPPGIGPEHEPAPIEDLEEDEEPDFNVDQRREIEKRLIEDRVILRGFLLKQDKLRQWRRRWFVLRQNTLSYYHNEKEYEVKQILRRDDVYDIRGPDPSTAKARSLRRTYFKIVTEKRNYWLAHDDAGKAREWFAVLVRWQEGADVSPISIRQSISAQHTVGGIAMENTMGPPRSTPNTGLPHSQPQLGTGGSFMQQLELSMSKLGQNRLSIGGVGRPSGGSGVPKDL
ncbi:hypothetical protein LPJ66_008159 [Kickxella alabastrina]|uniref:Uncharacterized protein n=1 Tax=Kickxella alabastrina TaxID=61397 RepID=A0ACC1I6U8_9FUNG|nr:hypothetical protein LPJ66_008159 [Kickxella alabastrina]